MSITKPYWRAHPSIAQVALQHPRVYNASQWALGAHLARRASIQALELRSGERLLDIGCGPAYYFDDLPLCDYFGFDTDSRYISWANEKFRGRGSFRDVPYTDEHRRELGPFDGIMLMGLLHHLADDEADALLGLTARSLSPRGRVVTLDTVLFSGQSFVSRVLAQNDRGRHVRGPEGYLDLANRHFERVEHRVVGHTLRMPSAHFLMLMRGPRGS